MLGEAGGATTQGVGAQGTGSLGGADAPPAGNQGADAPLAEGAPRVDNLPLPLGTDVPTAGRQGVDTPRASSKKQQKPQRKEPTAEQKGLGADR